MNYKELLKKYWFVLVVAIALVVFVVIYMVDTASNIEKTVTSKNVDGNYAVYSVDGNDVMADDFYKSLVDTNGLQVAFLAYQRAVMDKAIETTSDMQTLAQNYAAYVLQKNDELSVISSLKQMGYVNGIDDLVQYYIDAQKQQILVTDYLKANEAEYFTKYKDEKSPRLIYHILVKVADIETNTDLEGITTYIAHPTEEEQAKLDKILEALKTEEFTKVASEYSDDTSSANGGFIGTISKDNQSNYFPIFSETSLELEDDQVSEVITSQAGYHIIWNAGSSLDVLSGDSEFLTSIQKAYPLLGLKAVDVKAKEFGFEIVDEEFKALVNSQLNQESEAE